MVLNDHHYTTQVYHTTHGEGVYYTTYGGREEHLAVKTNRAAAEALAKIDPNWRKSEAAQAAVPVLLSALKDEQESLRQATIWALGQIGDTRATNPLIEALKDKQWKVREIAAEALGEIGDARSIEPLAVALKDQIKDVRRSAAWALGQIGDEHAIEPLVAAINYDLTSHGSNSAALALVRIRNARGIEALVRLLDDWNKGTAAALALGAIGDPRSVGTLIRLVTNTTIAERVVSLLKSILCSAAPQINPEDLRLLTQIKAFQEKIGHLSRKGKSS